MSATIWPDTLSGAAGLAGVRDALYGSRSRRELRTDLRALLAADARLGTCRLERAKFKPGRTLTGYYAVAVDAAGGATSRGVEVRWSVGDGTTSGPDELAMQEEARAAGVLAPFRGLRHESATCRVSVAPLDVEYPHLVRLSRPDYAQHLLAETYEQIGGTSAAKQYNVSTVRYRPRQRHLLRYDPADGGETVFAKLYQPGKAARAVLVAMTVADAVERAGPHVGGVRPLGDVPLDDVVLYPRVHGSPLSDHLTRRGPVPRQHLIVAGALLRSLHDGVERPDEAALELSGYDLAAELRATGRAAEHLEPLAPRAAEVVRALLDRAGALHAALPDEPARFAHGDFKCDHLWVTGPRLTVLDFDTCCLAEPAMDVGKFLADLTWWYGRRGGPGLLDAQAAFLTGYGEMPTVRASRSRLVEAVVLTKISIRRLRRFEPDWDRRMEELVDRAAGCLRSLTEDQVVSQPLDR